MASNDAYAEIIERGRRNGKSYATALKSLKKKGRIPLNRLFAAAHEEAFELIDCLSCGRCCRELGPRLTQGDIGRLAARERQKPAAFIDAYLKVDEDGDAVFASMPCPFLGPDLYCGVYEDRPKACRDYPHLKTGRKDAFSLHIENLRYCPAVVLAVESIIAEYRR